MGWDFFRSHAGRRAGGGSPFPPPAGDAASEDTSGEEATGLDYETAQRGLSWQPLDARPGEVSREWPARPTRFVDGKDDGQTVAWLRSPEGYPVPVRLGQIGAVVMRNQKGRLVREWALVERVVAVNIDLFGWEEIEPLARALRAEGLRLLPTPLPYHEGVPYTTFECEPMRKAAQNRALTEMIRLEKQAVRRDSETPTLLDGRLAPRYPAFGQTDPVIGLIKTHNKPYLQTRQQWEVLYDLRPGQRTPAFGLDCSVGGGTGLQVVTCYVRISDGSGGESLDSGIVRLELTRAYFEQILKKDWDALDRLAGLVTEYRCKDQTYGRAACSIHPIVRAEESLGSLLTSAEALVSRFYHRSRL
jgi:hypothetical protein